MRNLFKSEFQRNSSRDRLWLENSKFSKIVPSGALVLDAGAGDAPYKALFSHTKYESADFEKVDKTYAKSTYVCDLSSIPVEDERFDYILFNQVMEHLPHPDRVLSELFRVLKPGGKMIYTAPLFYEEHEQPYDFFRYTQFAVRMLFNEAGFEIERLDWLEGYYSTLGYMMNTAARYMPLHPSKIAPGSLGYLLAPFFLWFKLSFAVLSVLFNRLELRHKYTERGFPKNFVAIVARPTP
ncbi:class I SAM-dependent methyltransferase [Bradyrhizobium glycinis]|uniref:class I SAM-dependent methyltransferase n=1 Tax=Bradyrhizobium glycinis TaxID=2751812 RepID=UPI0018D9A4CF|nr:class I SAM-dependent methyltransferase [Bradyrhizobium glycinis]MBH5368995.1 class I SAM-dependent methyltransferase [Bradyrhizobium glycinis]